MPRGEEVMVGHCSLMNGHTLAINRAPSGGDIDVYTGTGRLPNDETMSIGEIHHLPTGLRVLVCQDNLGRLMACHGREDIETLFWQFLISHLSPAGLRRIMDAEFDRGKRDGRNEIRSGIVSLLGLDH